MEGYSATIISSSRELTAKERIRFKDTSKAAQLDELVQPDQSFVLDYDFYLDIQVHNEHAKGNSKDYSKRVIVDTAGNAFVTGSESFITAMDDILKELAGEDDIQLECYKVASKNYQGKHFLSCTVV